MEQTLAIIKPDAVQRNLAGKILARLEAEGFVMLGLKMVCLSKQDAERFYAVHRDRPFFESLTSYMASGPAIPILLQRDNAIQALRESDGSYQPRASSTGTIRQEFGLDVEKNAMHGSDSPASAGQEIPFFFNYLEFRERS